MEEFDAKLGLILTNDWELYGDGSGDYFELQHKPLQELLKTVEGHGAKLTIMAEVGQQWAHQRISEQEAWAREIADCWESILKETIQRKHDVQLHLHPQWLNAKYENNKWNVDLSQWAIPSLPDSTIEKVLKDGKQYLDSLLQPVAPNYECIAFRAGDYCLQPSRAVIHGLLQAGILCDSSVTKGMYDPQFYDYRGAYSNFLPWFASTGDIKYNSGEREGLLEIPIYSYETLVSLVLRELFPQLSNLLSFRTRISKQDREWLARNSKEKLKRYPLRSRPFMAKNMRSFKWLRSILISKSCIQLDYDKLPPNIFVKCIRKIYESKDIAAWNDKQVIIPVVVSGHVKGMYNCENIARILDEVDICFKGKVVFWTISDAVRYWTKMMSANSKDSENSLM